MNSPEIDCVRSRGSNEYQVVSETAAQITIAAIARPGRNWMRALRNISGLLKKALTLLLRWRFASTGTRAAAPFREPCPRGRSHYFSAGDSRVEALQGLHHFLDFTDWRAGGDEFFY